ncbi:unnamed protein product [Caenorhabditis nigoni]
MSSIIEMPELVLEKIIEFSDFKSVLSLRQVCRGFRNFINNLNDSKLPDSKFTNIYFFSKKENNKIILEFVDSDDYFYSIVYSETENSRSFNGKTTDLGSSNIVDVAIRDLELILKFQKSILESIFFTFDDFRHQHDSELLILPIKLSNMLKATGRKIKTRQLTTKTYDESKIMSVLPFADLEALKVLHIYSLNEDENNDVQMDFFEISETEQWKKAKRMDCDFRVLNLIVEDVSHFSKLSIKVPSITARDLDFLKKTYINSSKFERAIFDLLVFNEREEISNLWGPAYRSGSSSHWYFRTKPSEEEILRIEFCDIYPPFFLFGVVGPGDVLDGAIVQDYNEN